MGKKTINLNFQQLRLFIVQYFKCGDTLKKVRKPIFCFCSFQNFCKAAFQIPKPRAPISTWKIGVEQQYYEVLRKSQYSLSEKQINKFYIENNSIAVRGGRTNALKILEKISQFKNYNAEKNCPAIRTTKLSAHLQYNTVSIRQVYYKVYDNLGKQSGIITDLYRRDFYCNIAYYFPNVLSKGQNTSFKQKFDKIPWKYNQYHLQCWKKGETGFPIVDAAMRQLNQTGFMHGRCRQIAASFLSKHLFLQWKIGQKYFASKLVDYSSIQNSAGWQSCVGNGADSNPYFRIFSPWTQQKNYDEKCIYIKKWIPQLETVPAADIHQWHKTHEKYLQKGIKYFSPIVTHEEAREEALNTFKQMFGEKQSKSQKSVKIVIKILRQQQKNNVSLKDLLSFYIIQSNTNKL